MDVKTDLIKLPGIDVLAADAAQFYGVQSDYHRAPPVTNNVRTVANEVDEKLQLLVKGEPLFAKIVGLDLSSKLILCGVICALL